MLSGCGVPKAPLCSRRVNCTPRKIKSTALHRLRGTPQEKSAHNSSSAEEDGKHCNERRNYKFKEHHDGGLGPNIAAVYNMSVEEAKSLGIPEYALPELGKEPTLEEAREAQKKIDSIVASFLSADI